MTPRLASLLKRLQPAGVILFARNIKNAEQTWRLLRECQECVAARLFTCVDLEGGTVDRFRGVLGPTPSVADVFAADDAKLACRHGQVVGENCRTLGFNVDFAPVLDLAFEASRGVMGSRSASADPRETAAYAKEFLAGLKAARVLGCGKHFPGLGEGNLDSHQALPVIEKSKQKLWAEDLLPYRLLARQLPMTMIAHAAYPQVTGDRTPASLSSFWIANILKQRIGYGGLVISDDLEMGGVLAAAPVGQAAVESVLAGADLCLVCHHEEFVLQAYEGLTEAVERDRRFNQRVAESARRVAAFKKKYEKLLRPGKSPTPSAVEKLSRRLWEFSEQVRLAPLSRREDRRRQDRQRNDRRRRR